MGSPFRYLAIILYEGMFLPTKECIGRIARETHLLIFKHRIGTHARFKARNPRPAAQSSRAQAP